MGDTTLFKTVPALKNNIIYKTLLDPKCNKFYNMIEK